MKFLLCLLALSSPLLAKPAAAAPVPAPAHWALTPHRPANLPRLPATDLSYSLTWKGRVAAGEVHVQFGPTDPAFPNHYLARAQGASSGFASRLFPYSFDFLSLLETRTLAPRRFHFSERDKSSTTRTTAVFSRTGVQATEVETPDKKSQPPTTKVRSLAYTGAHDLFSTLLHVRSQTLATGESIVLVTHPTTRGYLATIKVLAREPHAGHNAIKLSVSMQRIQEDLSLRPYEKMQNATLWLSDDAHRIPLELRTQTFIGEVRMLLSSWNVKPATPAERPSKPRP